MDKYFERKYADFVAAWVLQVLQCADHRVITVAKQQEDGVGMKAASGHLREQDSNKEHIQHEEPPAMSTTNQPQILKAITLTLSLVGTTYTADRTDA